jgi:hypothetical protein
MKVTVNEDFTLKFEEVFNPIELVTSKGEKMSICMRDGGFEFNYQGRGYSARNGALKSTYDEMEQKPGNLEQKSIKEIILGFEGRPFQLKKEGEKTIFLTRNNLPDRGYSVSSLGLGVYESYVNYYNIVDFVEQYVYKGYSMSLNLDKILK